MAYWGNLWLNEGFADFFETESVDAVRPSWALRDQFLFEDQQRAMATDALSTTHPIVMDPHTENEISAMFDSITYSKGGSILRMLQAYLRSTSDTYASSSILWRHRTILTILAAPIPSRMPSMTTWTPTSTATPSRTTFWQACRGPLEWMFPPTSTTGSTLLASLYLMYPQCQTALSPSHNLDSSLAVTQSAL